MSSNDNNENNRSDRGRLEQEALAWVLKMTSGKATAADRDAFLRWRARGSQYEAAALDAMRLWQRVGSAAAIQRAPRHPSRRLFLQGGAMAASVAGLAFAGSKLGFLPAFQDVFADYKTVAGEQRRLSLPGDITVELNTRSGLSLDRQKGDGYLELVSGEAAFTAPAGSSLSVSAARAIVSADGAMFLVRREGALATVSCLEGSVEMLAPQMLRLSKGQRAICDGERVATHPIADIDAVAAWRKGQLVFRDEPLAEVVEELNRYKKGLVIVIDDAAARRRVTGVFHLGRVNEALDHIGVVLDLPVRHLSPLLALIG